MSFEFKLPDLGEGVAEGEIVEWKVAVGDTVEEDTPLVEVMTDKATVEIPSPQAGTIESLHAEPGDMVPVGSALVTIGGGAAAPAAPAAEPASAPAETPAPAAAPTPAPAPALAAPAAPAPAPAAAASAPSSNGRVKAAPATRKLARELGVDLGAVAASGPRGRVTADDVQAHASGGATAAPEAPARAAVAPAASPSITSSTGRETRTPYRGLRRTIGDQMQRSAFTAPHFTLVEEIDMTEVDRLRKTAKEEGAKRGVKVTYLPFIMKALCGALKQHPSLNGVFDEPAGEIINYSDVHVGFALDTDRGLMVPVIHDAHRKNIFELSEDLTRLSEAGREGTIAREDMQGSTITITSAGSIGGLFATPIINHPELGILGVYRIEDRPVVRDGEIVVRKMSYMSVTLDHRIVDGGEAARFMRTMQRLLGDPTALLLEG